MICRVLFSTNEPVASLRNLVNINWTEATWIVKSGISRCDNHFPSKGSKVTSLDLGSGLEKGWHWLHTIQRFPMIAGRTALLAYADQKVVNVDLLTSTPAECDV